MTAKESNTAHDDAVAARRKQVATLRLMHYTQREISAQLGVSVATVNRDLEATRDEWVSRRDQQYGEWVAEELAKLDALERVWLPRALSQNNDEKAVTKVLSIMDRRARMLGLDQPERFQVQLVTVDMIDAEIARLERELSQASGAGVIELGEGGIPSDVVEDDTAEA